METCCATKECVNKPNDAVFTRHREVPARACGGWKLEWTDPGPEVKVVRGIVSEPFEEPKIVKAVPYQIVSKCGYCIARHQRRLHNGIPDPWLEYLEQCTGRGEQEDVVLEKRTDMKFVRKCVKITDFIWHKKGLALLQGIPDPWKADLPCACEIEMKPKNKKKKFNKEESPRYRNLCHKEKSLSHSSQINKEFPRRRSSSKSKEHSEQRSKNYCEQPIRRQSNSEDKIARCAICYAIENSKTAHVCYGGIVPPCLKDYFVQIHHSNRKSKYHEDKFTKSPIKKYCEEPVRRPSKTYDEKVPTKRRNKSLAEGPTKRRSRSYENEIIDDSPRSYEDFAECRNKCQTKSIIKDKKKESIARCRGTTSDNSTELSDEALKKSETRSNTAKHKVEERKTYCTSKKLRVSGFEKVKQRLQELQNELKAKEAAKDLQLREIEQLSKLRKKARKGKKRTGNVREHIGRQKGNDLDESDRSAISPRGNFRLKDGANLIYTDKNKIKKEDNSRNLKTNICYNSKHVSCWLDEPDFQVNKKLPKESPKSAKKIEALRATSHNTKELKTPQTPLKSIHKDTKAVTVKPCTPQIALYRHDPASTVRTPSPRRVSYSDEPQPTCRTCSPYCPKHRRAAHCEEAETAMSKASSPCCKRYEASYVDEAVSPHSNLSKNARCTSVLGTSSTGSLKDSKESVKKFLDEINSRIEITQDALNSPCMKSVAVQPFREETAKAWHCPGRELCPRMRERAGGDEGSELFVRRIRNEEDNAVEIETISKFNDESGEDSDASDCNAEAEWHLQPSYPKSSMSDFKRRQKEIEELFVESFSEFES